jgi:hypothetical protein
VKSAARNGAVASFGRNTVIDPTLTRDSPSLLVAAAVAALPLSVFLVSFLRVGDAIGI